MKVNYEQVVEINKQRRAINKPEFKDLEVYKGGKLVHFTPEMKKTAKYTGLLNFDLIEIFVTELEKGEKIK